MTDGNLDSSAAETPATGGAPAAASSPVGVDAAAPAGVVAGPQAVSAVTRRPVAPGVPTVLTPAQYATLAAALNRIIPSRDGLPGAGDLGVAAAIARTLSTAVPLRRLFLDGLTAIELTAASSAPESTSAFVALDAQRQDDALRAVEETLPAFFAALVDHAYRGYYTLPAVHRAIGYESRPPQPLGYRLAPFDPALLKVQQRRAPFWRRVP